MKSKDIVEGLELSNCDTVGNVLLSLREFLSAYLVTGIEYIQSNLVPVIANAAGENIL
jgi:hypothetical protein